AIARMGRVRANVRSRQGPRIHAAPERAVLIFSDSDSPTRRFTPSSKSDAAGESPSGIVSHAQQRTAPRRSGTSSRHSPQGRLFVVCLALGARRRGHWLGQPRNRGSMASPARTEGRKPVSLPCPKRDRSGLPVTPGASDFTFTRISEPHRRPWSRRGIVSHAQQRTASRRPGTHSRHAPQGRLFVVSLAPVWIRSVWWLGQPRNRGSPDAPDPYRRRKPVSLPCPKRDRSDEAALHGRRLGPFQSRLRAHTTAVESSRDR